MARVNMSKVSIGCGSQDTISTTISRGNLRIACKYDCTTRIDTILERRIDL